MGIFYAVLSGVLLLVNGITCSIGSISRKHIFVFNFFAPLFTMILAMLFSVNWPVVFRGEVPMPFLTIFVLLISSVCGLGYVLFLMFAMNRGPHALSLCIGESCLIIPYLVSIVIWSDPLVFRGALGVALIAISVIAIGRSKQDNLSKRELSSGWFMLILCAFLLGGIELTLYTWPNRWDGWSDMANIRPALIQIGRLPVLIPLVRERIVPHKKTMLIALIAASFNLIVITVQFRAMDYLVVDGLLGILYPLSMGTYILLFTSYGLWFRKERLSAATAFAMVCILIGILLVGL